MNVPNSQKPVNVADYDAFSSLTFEPFKVPVLTAPYEGKLHMNVNIRGSCAAGLQTQIGRRINCMLTLERSDGTWGSPAPGSPQSVMVTLPSIPTATEGVTASFNLNSIFEYEVIIANNKILPTTEFRFTLCTGVPLGTVAGAPVELIAGDGVVTTVASGSKSVAPCLQDWVATTDIQFNTL